MINFDSFRQGSNATASQEGDDLDIFDIAIAEIEGQDREYGLPEGVYIFSVAGYESYTANSGSRAVSFTLKVEDVIGLLTPRDDVTSLIGKTMTHRAWIHTVDKLTKQKDIKKSAEALSLLLGFIGNITEGTAKASLVGESLRDVLQGLVGNVVFGGMVKRTRGSEYTELSTDRKHIISMPELQAQQAASNAS